MSDHADIAVIGLGAAGLMAAIWAGRTARAAATAVAPRAAGSPTGALRIVGLDGAAKLGAKILVAGGGRCNVTHHQVSEGDYAGSSRHAIKKVLRSFDVDRTVAFFRELGVELKREETGKLFPVSDSGRTVLDALLRAAREAGVELRHPARVEQVVRVLPHSPPAPGGSTRAGRPDASSAVGQADAALGAGRSDAAARNDAAQPAGFEISGPWGVLHASCVIIATGGMALPKTGSDGIGYTLARGLGHTVTPRVFPALAPLRLDAGHFLCGLSGLSAPATVEVRASSGKRLESFTGPVLCTHFGLSGPAIMNISRHLTAARFEDPGATLALNWLPGTTPEQLDRALLDGARTRVSRVVAKASYRGGMALMDAAGEDARDPSKPGVPDSPDVIPQRLMEALCAHAGVGVESPCASLTRDQRRAVVEAFCALRAPVMGDRGFTFAEATAGGVPLSELVLSTMESRVCPGLHLCGEVCDVDGRIGGFNFQWAWASGFLAGCAAGR